MKVSSVLAWLALLFMSPNLHAQITLYTMENFVPYSWIQDGQPTGIDIEIIQLLSQKSGVPITIRLVPWKRVIHETKWGHVDGAFSLFKTKERESFAKFVPTPIHESTFKVFVRKGEEFKFDSISDLHGKFIGKNTAFYISKEFEQAKKEKLIQVEEASMKQNIRAGSNFNH